MIDRRFMLALVGAACCACGEDRSVAPVVGLPAEQRLLGTAAGPRGDGGSIDCGFELRLTLTERRRTPAFIEYTGSMGGEAHRTTVDATGAGFGFWADLAWPSVVARLVGQDSLEFLVGDTTVTDSRFWRELAFFGGRRISGDQGSGAWTCAPFDIWENGYVDTIGVVRGTWSVVSAQ